MTTAFKYSPLDPKTAQFRLLELEAAEQEDAPLSCHLEVYDFDRRPEYEALSYTWGQFPASRAIWLNGHYFAVRPNLEQALRHLRLPSRSRILWIDAICISQSDLDEKSRQLAHMRRIFAKADPVLIWLGGPDEEVESLFRYLVDYHSEDDSKWPEHDDPKFIAAMPGFLKLFQNGWWKRVWTAQELVVATKDPLVICGYSQLPWETLNGMIICLTVMVPNTDIPLNVAMEPIHNVRFLRRIWQKTIVRGEEPKMAFDFLTLENLLITTSNRQATNPKDQIFAVLGMMPPQQQTHLVQNYNETVSRVYQRAMVEAIESSGGLEFLRYAMIPKGSNRYSLPSWCLDFSVPDWNDYSEDYHTFLTRSRVWEEMNQIFTGISLGRPLEIRHDETGESISVLGTKIGTVLISHRASTVRVLQHSETATLRTRVARGMSVNRDIIAQRGLNTLHAILNDYKRFWFVIPETLERRLGFEKAYQLLHEGVVWRVFDGGMNEAANEKTQQNLRKWGLENEKIGYYELVMQWAQQYIATGALDQDEDESESENEEGNETGEDNSSEDVEVVHNDGHIEDAGFGDALYEDIVFEVFGIGSRATGKAFFATDTGFVGRSDHVIQGLHEVLPSEMRWNRGDIVCVLQKCTRPVVLRPCGDGRFKLVSFAYVHDVFEDSDTAIDMNTREGEWFELC